MKKIATPRYEPLEWDGESYTVLANPPLRILEDIERNFGATIRAIVREHPYVDADGAPADLADVDVGELRRFVTEGYVPFLRNLPKG